MAIVYVDPSTGVDDGGTAGTSGDPYLTIQYAIDNYPSWATTEGNTIKLANTAALVLSSPMNTASISTIESPLCIEGWDNGGSITATGPRGSVIPICGEIDGNDAVAFLTEVNTTNVTLKNLKLHGCTTHVLYFSAGCIIINCEIYDAGSSILIRAVTCYIINCYIHSDAGAGWLIYGPQLVENCELSGCDESIYTGSNHTQIINNYIHSFLDSGIMSTKDWLRVVGNTIDGSSSSSTGVGIEAAGELYELAIIYNNLITNFDGATAKGIYLPAGSVPSVLGNNAFYNCTTEVDTPTPALELDNITETSDPYVDSASYNFKLKDGALSKNSAQFS